MTSLIKSLINMVSMIHFAWNGLLIASHILGLAFDVILPEKSILANQINDSIYVSKLLWANKSNSSLVSYLAL
jgi:hypothetical protein